MRRCGPLSLLLLVAGCRLVTNFDLNRAVESTDALCSDGVDNDGNGLTDCQDWKCLGRTVCCTMPVVVLADDFKAGACARSPCSAPDPTCAIDPAKWAPWGQPLPVICDGGLSPNKAEQCYDVGVLAREPLQLHPGLSVVAHVRGQPELAGRLEVGLTLQESIAGGATRCSPVEGASPVVSLREVGSAGGFQVVASFDRREIGRSAEVTNGDRHELHLYIGSDRRAHYELDGVAFADSPADQTFPAASLTARLSLSGRGLAARFDDVRVTDGTQCDDPAAWTAATPFVAIDTSPVIRSWDSFRVFNPAVWPAPTGEVLLYYTGCAESNLGGDCSPALGVGRAQAADALVFVRDPTQRLRPTSHLTLNMDFIRPADPTDRRLRAIESTNAQATINDQVLFSVTDTPFGAPDPTGEKITGPNDPNLRPGLPGSWDDAEICCASAIEEGGRLRLWYAGRAQNENTWRVGTAESTDGGQSFVRSPANPVLREGGREEFDGRGMLDPEVVYDKSRQLYRMWYTAQAFLGITTIGYAVSVDGVTWHKFPANPVIVPSALGLESVGSPAVLPLEGLTRLWLHGNETGKAGVRIYGLQNHGSPPR